MHEEGNWSQHRLEWVGECWRQYSSRSGSAGRSRVEQAGEKEGRDEGDVW